MQLFSNTSNRGFTLIEVIVSVAVFLIVMTAVTNTFTSGFSNYKSVKKAQKNLEDVQFAMNLIAKELRTSTVVVPDTNDTVSTIRFYDYSQGACIEYVISATQITKAKVNIATMSGCSSANLGTATPLVQLGSATGALISGRFIVRPSVSGSVAGKVTISLQIRESATQIARIQSTVSLRDYDVSLSP